MSSISRQSTFTFGSFLRQISRSTPQEAKLLMLRSVELFHVRPDMFTKTVNAVPWENALALMDSAFYVLKEIEPKSYQVALSKVAFAQAEASQQQEQQRAVNERGEIGKNERKISPSNNNTCWIASLKLLSRLVQAEGDQTPPSAFVLAAQSLSPTRQWEQAIRFLLKPADDRGVNSKALLLNVAESCATPTAWRFGLRALLLSKPASGSADEVGWLLPPKVNESLKIAASAASSLTEREQQEQLDQRQQQYEQNSRILTKLVAAAPWNVAMSMLLPRIPSSSLPSSLSSASASKKEKYRVKRKSLDARSLGATSAVLDDENNMSMLLESWLARSKNNNNNNNNNNQCPPADVLKRFMEHSSCFSSASIAHEWLPALSASTNKNLVASPSTATTSETNELDTVRSSTNRSKLTHTQLRLLVSVALRARDIPTLASLLNRVGTCSVVGKNRASAAILLILLSSPSSCHDAAVQIAQRCLAEGVQPLSSDCLKALIASYHRQAFDTTMVHSSTKAPIWYEALGLVGGLASSSSSSSVSSASISSSFPSPLSSATGEELLASSNLRHTSLFLDDARTLTKLIQLCAVASDAPAVALRLIGLAKNSTEHQHQRRSEVKLQHEKIVSALLFCQQYGRWREATTVFVKFCQEQKQIMRKKELEGVVKVLRSILEVIMKKEGKEEMFLSLDKENRKDSEKE